MNIVIVGGGLVGSTLAQKLSEDGHDISLVERDEGVVRELRSTLDVQVVQGNGTTARTLREAGVERAAIVVATTDSDEVNIVVGLVAGTLFDVGRIVVRLRDSDHEEGFAEVSREHGVDYAFVNPIEAAVDRIQALLEVPGALDVASFLDGELLVAGFRIGSGSDFAGLLVSHVQLMFAGTPTLAVAIRRGGEWIIPNGSDEIRPDDRVYFVFSRADLADVVSLVGAEKEERRHIMIAGADRIGLALAQRLEGHDGKVVLIEADADLAAHAAAALENTVVVHGPVTERPILEEEEVERVSTFVAVTGDHETNLVSGLLARRIGAGRAFALVDNPALVDLLGEVGIDAVISPRLLAIGLILRHIHGESVRSVAPLLEDRVELLEADAVDGSKLVSGTLAEVGLPRGVLVAAVRRGEAILVPRGEDAVEVGDRVVLIASVTNAAKLAEFLDGPQV
jgi:trk system potassium uptake protein TrkA